MIFIDLENDDSLNKSLITSYKNYQDIPTDARISCLYVPVKLKTKRFVFESCSFNIALATTGVLMVLKYVILIFYDY